MLLVCLFNTLPYTLPRRKDLCLFLPLALTLRLPRRAHERPWETAPPPGLIIS